MKIYTYDDYDHYVDAQTRANKRKLKNVWVEESTILTICHQQPATNILCHGTRNGMEQQLFQQYFPTAFVIGTEISETAQDFEHTVQYDFHKENADWIRKFDIVYSNSLDHAHDPGLALNTWKAQLNATGKLFVEFGVDAGDNRSRESDPLEINHTEVVELFSQCGLVLLDTFDTIGSTNHNARVYIAQEET